MDRRAAHTSSSSTGSTSSVVTVWLTDANVGTLGRDCLSDSARPWRFAEHSAYSPAMGRARALLVAAAAVVGALSGWAISLAHGSCEYSCPARPPCFPPQHCGTSLGSPRAAVLGALIALAIFGVGWVLLAVRKPD